MEPVAPSLPDRDLFEAIRHATEEILRDVLHETAAWGSVARREGTLFPAGTVHMAVGLAGDVCGHLGFGMDRDVAKALAEAMLGDPLPDLDAPALDTLCELALLIAGHARGELQGRHLDLAITPPVLITGDRMELLWHGMDPLVAAVRIRSGTVHVTLGLRPDRPAPAGLRVLVVDDMKFVRYTLAKIIAERGWEVVGEAENGEEAVQKYQLLKPDVVTMDITMPGMDGIAACRSIVTADPDARILMLTAQGQMDRVVEAMHAGARDFVTKPFKKDRVCAGIEAVVSGRPASG